MTVSVVLIIPADRLKDAHDMAIALGQDEKGVTYGVPLSADGQAPATHYGTHWWDQNEKFKWLADAREQKQVDERVSKEVTDRVGSAIASSVRPIDDEPRAHFDTFAESQGLRAIVREPGAKAEAVQGVRK